MFNSTSGAAAAQHPNLEQQQDGVVSILSWVIDDVPESVLSSMYHDDGTPIAQLSLSSIHASLEI